MPVRGLVPPPGPSYPARVYEPPRQDERPGCRETWVLTRAVFSILLPFIGVMFLVLVAVTGVFVAFSVHPALALIPLAAIVLGIALFARWERSRFQPPDV